MSNVEAKLYPWVVLYRPATAGFLDTPVGVTLMATDIDQAEVVCQAQAHGCTVLWVMDADFGGVDEAIKDWLTCGNDDDLNNMSEWFS